MAGRSCFDQPLPDEVASGGAARHSEPGASQGPRQHWPAWQQKKNDGNDINIILTYATHDHLIFVS
jgi:hypothetical protein